MGGCKFRIDSLVVCPVRLTYLGSTGSVLASDRNPYIHLQFTLTKGALAVNSAQVLLSFWYLAYNNLLTRIQTAREWALFGRSYHPLRVTDPKVGPYSLFHYWHALNFYRASNTLHTDSNFLTSTACLS